MLTALAIAFTLAVPQGNEGYVTTSDSARLFYRVIGHGRDTIIAIHGGPGVDLESIAGDFAPLAQSHVVIFYDQRGAGRSELPADTSRLRVARQVQDLDEVRAHFRLERVTLVAHSYGPLLAASYAIAHPTRVNRMVFFGPVPPRRGDFWTRFGATMQERLDSASAARLARLNRDLRDSTIDARATCRAFWDIAMRPRLFDAARSMPLIKSDLCASDPNGIRYGLTTTNRVVMASYGDWDLRSELRTLPVPTLVLHGEADAIPMDLVAEWASSLPYAQLVRVPRAAHFPYAENPTFVWPAVEKFLASPAPGGSLRAALEMRIRAEPGATVAVSYLDLTTGDTLHLNADDSFHAASTMKVPVMVEMFRQVDRKTLALDRRMTLKNEFHSIVDGSTYQLDAGADSDSLVYTWVGQGVPLRDLLERMIVRSSNLATNALIEIVDAKKANATAHALGARNIRVLRGVEDGKAFAKGLNNTTTSRDLAVILAAIAKHRAASAASCDSMIAILSRQEFNDEIPAGLPADTRVAHKTGSITAVMHDAAIVYPAAGRPYVLVVLTKGIRDETISRALIADLSRIVYRLTGRN